MTVTLSLALDVAVLALLAGTILYAGRLHAALGRLRDGRAEMERLVGELGAACQRAEGAITGLKGAFGEAEADLGRRIAQAKDMAGELSLVTSLADELAGRLERAAASRGGAPAAAPAVPAAPTVAPGTRPAPPRRPVASAEPPTRPPAPRSRAERELMDALQRGEA